MGVSEYDGLSVIILYVVHMCDLLRSFHIY